MYDFTNTLTLSIIAEELAGADILSEDGVMFEGFEVDVRLRDVANQSCSYRVLDLF